MGFLFIKKVQDIKDFVFCFESVIKLDCQGDLHSIDQSLSCDIDIIGSFESFNDQIFINSWNGSYIILDNKLSIIEKGEGKGFFKSSQFYLGIQYLQNEILCEGIMNRDFEILDVGERLKKNNINFSNESSYCFLENTSIVNFNIELKSFDWSFDLKVLGTFVNEDGKVKNYVVERFLGLYNDVELLIACNGRLIISIDINSGKLERTWQHLEGFGSEIYGGVFLNKIPPANGFQLNIDKNILYSIAGQFIVVIELNSGDVWFKNLESTMNSNFIENFRYSIGYAEDESHFYTIGEMNQNHFETDYIPQCLLSINKVTFSIDWVFRFENDGVKTELPKLFKNRLYQLTSSNTLHIFQKQQPPT
ncbi:hypothetical protein K6119_15690 [Paracrocinitomix mangrovi]|uniref:hypothetical protein n=1 Tax=Paracrocinitomix mangrovi TaxID=2862509 RepID=UPI001C8E4CC8|nr:hypothetical protein [Paracrocinitomix mangrovi]UKN01172.1 hypothetical protein K6119_15690 [Paracrocinitomix mangrovi]